MLQISSLWSLVSATYSSTFFLLNVAFISFSPTFSTFPFNNPLVSTLEKLPFIPVPDVIALVWIPFLVTYWVSPFFSADNSNVELFKSTSPETFISEPRVEINLESAEATYPPLTKVFPLLTTVPPLLIPFSNLVLLVANVPFLPTFTFEVYDFPFITTAPSFNVVFPLNVLAPFNTNVPAPFFTSPTSPVISLSKL